jgi:hypothetical protein
MPRAEWQLDGWAPTVRLGVLTPAADARSEAVAALSRYFNGAGDGVLSHGIGKGCRAS